MQDQQADNRAARCQKCRSDMTHVTDLPHPIATTMVPGLQSNPHLHFAGLPGCTGPGARRRRRVARSFSQAAGSGPA